METRVHTGSINPYTDQKALKKWLDVLLHIKAIAILSFRPLWPIWENDFHTWNQIRFPYLMHPFDLFSLCKDLIRSDAYVEKPRGPSGFFNLLNKGTREPSTWATSSTWMRKKKKKSWRFSSGDFTGCCAKRGCFHCQRSPGCFWLGISVKSALQASAITQAVYSGESPHMESIIERHPDWWCLV